MQEKKKFVLTETFEKLSTIKEDELITCLPREHFDIPWAISIKKLDGNFYVYLCCEKELGYPSNWSIEYKSTIQIMKPGGMGVSRNCKGIFDKPYNKGCIMMKWKSLEKNYIADDKISVSICVKILRIKGISNPPLLPEKKFVLTHTIRNVSSMEEGKLYKGSTEERFQIPWAISSQKEKGYLKVYLSCLKEVSNASEWSIDTVFETKLVSGKGNNFSREVKHKFEKPDSCGPEDYIKWEVLKENHAVNDSVCVEIHVRIVKYTDIPCEVVTPVKQFVIAHTFKNISTLNSKPFGRTEERFNIPWRLSIRRDANGFFGAGLYCAEQVYKTHKWTISTDFEIKLLASSGNSLVKTGKFMFEKTGFAWFDRFLTWKDLENGYVVNDSVTLEAHVKVLGVTDSPRPNTPGLEFTFSYLVKNVSRIKTGFTYNSPTIERFGIPWKIAVNEKDGFLILALICEDNKLTSGKRTIETNFELSLKSLNGKIFTKYAENVFDVHYVYRFVPFVDLKDVELIDGRFIIEAFIKIMKINDN